MRPANRDTMHNGLYSIHVDLLDGRSGKGSGVILCRNGQILGGDAYLFYIGSYTTNGTYYTPDGPQSGGAGHYDHVHITTTGGGYPTGGEIYYR